MVKKVIETIAKYNMAQKGERLLCCLSGGADSVALLLCLSEFTDSLCACHLNHQLRGEESLRDESFCIELCESLNIPLEVKRVDVIAFCRENGYSLEEGARIVRYNFFDEASEKFGCEKIATAHTLSDSIETMLINLTRGTGISGLASIPPVRGNIIRPLIECTRFEIESFLNSRGQDWVTDSTNLSDDYTRNKIRHNVVEQLRLINPSLEKTMSGTIENLREDNEFIKRQSEELYNRLLSKGGVDCKGLTEADKALSGTVIAKLLSESSVAVSRAAIERVRGICENGGKVTVGDKLYAEAIDGKLYIIDEKKLSEHIAIRAELGKAVSFYNKEVLIEITEKNANVNSNATNFIADYDKINGEILIRQRESGDRVKLIGRDFTSDVKKLVQSGFERVDRLSAVVLSDNEGVIFVERFGFSQRVKADNNTKTYLLCKIS